MKANTILFLFLLAISSYGFAQPDFKEYFENEGSLRVDYNLSGQYNEQQIFLYQIRKESFYAGSQKNLIDPFVYGSYYFEVYDKAEGKLIFSRGFNTLFEEWQTTDESKTERKAFKESLCFPLPKEKVVLKILKSRAPDHPAVLYETEIDPSNPLITQTDTGKYKVFEYMINGKPRKKVDILFIAEGYTLDEMSDFKDDVRKFSDYMFNQEPFEKNKNKFNIRAVCSYSDESGTDIPGKGIWKSTVVNSNFFTFGSERYLTTSDYWAVRDIAARAPYDQIVVLVNSKKYGGGGIYNHYSLFSANHSLSKLVFIHEFGHGFAGLGDEYYTSSVAYSEFYPLDKEPLAPNLTTLVDFESKWKDMVSQSTPIPTPASSEFENTVGLFEGGGYSAKGIYRPYIDCRMKSNKAKGFCPVCQRAIQRMIDFYTK